MLQHNHIEHDHNERQNVSKFYTSNGRHMWIYVESVQWSNDEYGAQRTIQIGWMVTEMPNKTSKLHSNCVRVHFSSVNRISTFVQRHHFQGLYIVRNFTLNSERFPTYTPEMKYNVTIQYLFAPNKRKPNELVEMVKIYVLGKMDSTIDVKRRRLALGRRTKKPGEHWCRTYLFETKRREMHLFFAQSRNSFYVWWNRSQFV